MLPELNKNNTKGIRYFNPFKKCDTIGEHVTAHYYTRKCGRRYELLYVGCGVFLGTIDMSKDGCLTYAGKRYAFQQYRPSEDVLRGIVGLYFVPELEDVGSPCDYLNFYHQGQILVDEKNKKMMSHTITFAGKVPRPSGLPDVSKELAREKGLMKAYMPREYVWTDGFVNKAVSVIIKGKEYPALLVVHGVLTMKKNCTAHGSIRIFSHKTFLSQWQKV